MIAYIDGKLTYKDPAYVIIDVNGVGYEIKISLQTYAALQDGTERCKLFTYLNIREDAHILYGFKEQEEKLLFLDLVSVSGIGPNTALVMLSSMSSAEIRHALMNEDVKTIQSIKGIGAKTAQRAIIELKDKLRKEQMLGSSSPSIFPTQNNKVRNEALAALVTLGIPKNVAEKSIDAILKKEGTEITVEQLIKMALR
ncbi:MULTISPECIES: Holliday junction branch migration protein RuvA [Arcicella]|uniref:Holliday junction branch migration complex subunit RuvA n=1 Tax=Arcicella lustrica TaxID=2984196 RepID=A0ABU5SP76_9BACT|nr:Holliday junction branch migration protein RuvA [Arcicella sp. DC25W]MEA5428754.1 Holliday junction branch migration protein RuvA [Arcicella sp. DC25W]|eukprot:Opistho-1_new@13701